MYNCEKNHNLSAGTWTWGPVLTEFEKKDMKDRNNFFGKNS